MKMYNHNNNDNQSQSEQTKRRTKRKREGRRWDAILVGIVFSIAFVLILTKVAQITPCEVINYFSIDTKTCDLVGNGGGSSNTNNNNIIERQLANQHDLGLDIINQYVSLTSELSKDIRGYVQQFLQNVGLLQ
jgi:hypothetical protein